MRTASGLLLVLLFAAFAALLMWPEAKRADALPAARSALRAPSPLEPARLAEARDPITSPAPSGGAAAPAPAPTPGFSVADFDACLRHADPHELLDCLRDSSTRVPQPAELAAWMCATDVEFQNQMLGLGQLLTRVPPARLWTYVDELQEACARHRETNFLKGAVLHARSLDRDWYEAVERSMTPDVLFSLRGGEAPVQLAVLFAQQGSPYARFLLEAGGRGDFGGNLRQIDRAASVSLALQQPGREFLSYLQSVMRSPSAPEEGQLGCTLATFLIDPRALVDGDALPSLLTLTEVLQDPRFQRMAALTVLHHTSDEPPAGADAETWSLIRQLARSVVPPSDW